MISHVQFYEKNLYPLQNRILKIVNSQSNPFYLTGGTALSRGYLEHRYSDDLDFFANDINNFQNASSEIIERIIGIPGISIISSLTTVSDSFIGFSIKDENGTVLKIDFVNDIPYRNGELTVHPILGRIDSIENILTNKLSALVGRTETKDAVDLWQICKKKDFSWKDEINKAMNKEASLDTLLISETLIRVSEEDFKQIKWKNETDYCHFRKDIIIIGRDILEENDNTLSENYFITL